MRYNETKRCILEALNERDVDPRSIYEILNEFTDISIKAVQMALLRYYRWGLLNRTKYNGIYNYEITDRGIERSNWLRKVQG